MGQDGVNTSTAKAGGLQLPRAGCRQRPVDCGPCFAADIDRGSVVRIQREAPSLAKERRLGLPIGLLTMPTGGAGATGSPRVYQMYRRACPCGLVAEELAQLEEGPGMPLVAMFAMFAMFASNRCSLSNPGQVFESECLARSDGVLYQGLADTVRHVLLETALPSGVPAQAALGVLRVDLVQSLTARMVARARLLDHGAAKRLTLAVGRQIDDTQVYAQHTVLWVGFGRRGAARRWVTCK